MIGTEDDIQWPFFSEMMDYEMEFGAWIGKPGKDVTPEQAKDMIFGYSVYNDVSARDTQAYEMPAGFGPGKGKDFETGNIIGPCIITADAFDPYDAEMIVADQRRGGQPRPVEQDVLEVRGFDRPCLAGRNRAPRRVFLFGHRRWRLRSGI